MSYLVTTPEWVTAAAGDLASINSVLQEAARAASAPTTGISAAAADEVSAAVSRLFGGFGQEFQAVSAQVSSYHADFVRLLDGSAAAYVSAEIANAGQVLANAVSAPSAAAAVPGGAYGQLVANTATNLQALGSSWAADPFPFFRQFLANQQAYAQQIASAFVGAIQNFPANLANLPATLEAAIQQALSFNAAFYVQQFIATQVGFAQTFVTSASNGFSSLVAGLPQFSAELQVAFSALLAGDYTGAVADVGLAFEHLLVTGFDPGPVTITSNLPFGFTATLNPKVLGPLGDFFTIMNLPGQEAQFLTDLTGPPLLRQIGQNFTNVLNTLTLPSISAVLNQPLTATGTLSAFFGLPLVFTYAAAGAPFSALNAMATSLQTFEGALATGDLLGAAGIFVDAPANILNGFLNAHNTFDSAIQVPTNLPFGLPPQNVTITLHLPADGILVPPHPVTATVDPHLPGIVNPFDVTVFGTPFMGLVPLLVNYTPQQLALAIAPAA